MIDSPVTAVEALCDYFLANADRGDNVANDELVAELVRRIRARQASGDGVADAHDTATQRGNDPAVYNRPMPRVDLHIARSSSGFSLLGQKLPSGVKMGHRTAARTHRPGDSRAGQSGAVGDYPVAMRRAVNAPTIRAGPKGIKVCLEALRRAIIVAPVRPA